MKVARLFGLVAGVVLALSLMAVAAASAADPEFKSSGGFPVTIKGLSLVSLLENASQTVTCKDDHFNGLVLGASKISNVTVLFLGCTAQEGEKASCSAKSKGGTTGDIRTATLDGELGLVAKAEAASGVGLLLLPETTKNFVTIEAECVEPQTTTVEGQIAGESTPIGVLSTTGQLIFGGKVGSQSIKTISVLGSAVSPKLTAFGVTVAQISLENIAFSSKIEVT